MCAYPPPHPRPSKNIFPGLFRLLFACPCDGPTTSSNVSRLSTQQQKSHLTTVGSLYKALRFPPAAWVRPTQKHEIIPCYPMIGVCPPAICLGASADSHTQKSKYEVHSSYTCAPRRDSPARTCTPLLGEKYPSHTDRPGPTTPSRTSGPRGAPFHGAYRHRKAGGKGGGVGGLKSLTANTAGCFYDPKQHAHRSNSTYHATQAILYTGRLID